MVMAGALSAIRFAAEERQTTNEIWSAAIAAW